MCRSEELTISGTLRVTGPRALALFAFDRVTVSASGKLRANGDGGVSGPGESEDSWAREVRDPFLRALLALDPEATCLATAVYFESMGEPLEGQLAVARVVINRAASGRYPNSWCAVVKQKAQFSFVRSGQFPRVDAACEAWRKAQAIARIAAGKMAQVIPTDVLWYHADYVAPSWGRRLARVDKIGAHIFYRA